MLSTKAFSKDLINIVKTIKKAGFKCFVVGGGVRDLILKKTVDLWDLTTDAKPEQISRLFKKVVPTGIKYGTVTVILNGKQYEITTFRSDERYVDGRHPSNVRFSKDIKADLCRRDFTINAIAYDPTTKELVDEHGGLADIKKKVIRTVGDPIERFREDGLRPLRACRFASKLNFKIDPNTLKAIPRTLSVAKKVSMERVHDELLKMLSADMPSIGLELMRKAGLLKLYIPELLKGIGVKQPKPFHKDDVYWHGLYSCDKAPKVMPILRLAALLHDIAKPKCKKGDTFYNHEKFGADTAVKIMKRLKFSNEHIKYVENLVKNHMFNYSPEWSDAAIRRFIVRVGVKNLNDLFMLRAADIKAMGRPVEAGHPRKLRGRIAKILKAQNALHLNALKVNGNDVMKALKMPPGPKVGEVLDKLLEKVIDDPRLNSRPELLRLMERMR